MSCRLQEPKSKMQVDEFHSLGALGLRVNALDESQTVNFGCGEFGQQFVDALTEGHNLFFGDGGSRIWGPMVERHLAERGVR
jgi:hypothetical protein